MSETDFDAIMIGSGAAGLTAAVAAAHAGLRVALVERAEVIGGTTALSGGAIWIPGHHKMESIGLDDSKEAAAAYLRAVLGGEFDPEIAGAFIDHGDAMLRSIEAMSELRMDAAPVPDYYPNAAGWALGRTLLPAAYDGRRLGSRLAAVRRPLPGQTLFGSMQLTPGDAVTLRDWRKSWKNAFAAAGLFLRYGFDRLIRGRSTRLAGGNAVVAALYKAAMRYRVTVLRATRATELLVEGGRVTGVKCVSDGEERTLRATCGVLLASGGCGADASARGMLLPNAGAGWSFQPESCTGDGWAMAEAAGAAGGETPNVVWTPASRALDKNGPPLINAAFWLDRHCPGSIMVDGRDGRRFIDESYHYQQVGKTALARSIERIWMISDRRAARKYGMGLARPAPFPIRPWVAHGYLVEADDIGGLAGKIGVDAAVLEETVARFNQAAASGRDEEFGRGEDRYSRAMGDHEHGPNPCLAPLVEAPFYALELRPCDLSVGRGVRIDGHARALSPQGKPIEGLYAAGLDASSILRGEYAGGGAAIGSAMTFAYIAAKQMIARKGPGARPSSGQ